MALSEIYTLDIRIGGAGPVRVISGSMAVATDETIYTPASGKSAFCVGLSLSETDATNLTFKSGSESIVALEMAGYQGILGGITNEIIVASEEGQALKANPSVAISSAVFYVIEAASLNFK